MAQWVQTLGDVVERSEDRLGELTVKFFVRLFAFFALFCGYSISSLPFAALREIFDFLRYSVL
jgi:hypothetical protein